MFLVDHRIGRLVEVRMATPLSVADAREIATRLAAIVGPFPGQVVTCIDLRRASVLSTDLAAVFIELMQRGRARIERAGILLPPDSPTFLLQLARVLREAHHPGRKTFTDPAELAKWLGEALDPAERARVVAFLDE